MYLSYAGSKGNKYYKIVESVREGKDSPRQKTILYLGRLNDKDAEKVRKWLDAFPLDPKDEFILCRTNELSIEEPRDVGDIVLIEALWTLIQMDEIIVDAHADCRSKRSCQEIFLALVANRCIEPKSKLEFIDWVRETELIEKFDGLKDLYPNTVYRAMDHIEKIRTDLEKRIHERLKKLFNISSDVIFYDLTSSFFTGKGPKKAHRGFSRDHRSDCRQVNWGLVVTKEGFPITHYVYDGNTLDHQTVRTIRAHLKKNFGVEECIFVADRGMLTIPNLKFLKTDGNKFILTDRERSIKLKVLQHIKHKPLNKFEKVKDNLWLSEYWTTEIWEGVEDGEPDEEVEVRYVVCYNPKKVTEEGRGTDAWLEKGKQQLKAVEKMVKNGRIKDHDKVLERIVKKLTKVSMDGFFGYKVPSSPVESFDWWVIEDKAKVLEKMMGFWVVKTNITEDEMSAREIALQYKQLQIIERAFRIIKVFNLVRPINHYKDERVECHIFICVMAYMLERVLEYIIEKRGESIIGHRLIRQFHNVKSVEVQAGDFKKRLTSSFNERQKTLLDYIEKDTM